MQKPTLHQRALTALEGVGTRTHEWHEWTGFAYHIRRRLILEEQMQVGDVRDIRGTPEAQERYDRCRALLPVMARRLAQKEITP